MNDFNGRPIHEIAGDWRIQAAVRQLDRLRAAENTVSELSTKLVLAEHALDEVRREIERSRGRLG